MCGSNMANAVAIFMPVKDEYFLILRSFDLVFVWVVETNLVIACGPKIN